MGRHCKASPSKMKQILGCTASLDAEEGFPDEESPYAAEGTACHEMAEYLIKKYLKIRTKRPNSDYYTDENLEAVDEYVSYVQEQIEEARKACKDPVFSVEQKVDLSAFVENCFGTADITCDLLYKEAASERAYELTGLENPNSVSQLKEWLAKNGQEVDSLAKDNVKELVKVTAGDV